MFLYRSMRSTTNSLHVSQDFTVPQHEKGKKIKERHDVVRGKVFHLDSVRRVSRSFDSGNELPAPPPEQSSAKSADPPPSGDCRKKLRSKAKSFTSVKTLYCCLSGNVSSQPVPYLLHILLFFSSYNFFFCSTFRHLSLLSMDPQSLTTLITAGLCVCIPCGSRDTFYIYAYLLPFLLTVPCLHFTNLEYLYCWYTTLCIFFSLHLQSDLCLYMGLRYRVSFISLV